MIEPYQALGLVPTMRGIRHRDEIGVNIEHLSHLIKAASWLSSLDLPVRLIAIPEGALQGFNDEVLDLDHEQFARECAIDIPGPETDALGALARQWNAFLMAQAKARHPEFPGRFFNIGFILSPEGEVILRHHKVVPLLPVEHSVTPHNVWDKWIELYGRNLDAFYPVADTEIGRGGFLMPTSSCTSATSGGARTRGNIRAVPLRERPGPARRSEDEPGNWRCGHRPAQPAGSVAVGGAAGRVRDPVHGQQRACGLCGLACRAAIRGARLQDADRPADLQPLAGPRLRPDGRCPGVGGPVGPGPADLLLSLLRADAARRRDRPPGRSRPVPARPAAIPRRSGHRPGAGSPWSGPRRQSSRWIWPRRRPAATCQARSPPWRPSITRRTLPR